MGVLQIFSQAYLVRCGEDGVMMELRTPKSRPPDGRPAAAVRMEPPPALAPMNAELDERAAGMRGAAATTAGARAEMLTGAADDEAIADWAANKRLTCAGGGYDMCA